MKATRLGEFEELVLLVTAILQDNAYGVSIVKELENHIKQSVSLSPVHTALYRLEKKGFLESELRGATNTRGGRRKRYYRITSAGFQAIERAKLIRNNLWNLLPKLN